MPIPFIIGAIAAGAGLIGAGAGIKGAVDMKDAKDTMESAQRRHERNVSRFKKENEGTVESMDAVGKKEMEVLNSFSKFSDLIERIQNRPKFGTINSRENIITKYDPAELKKTSIAAGAVLGSLGGAGLGVAGGFAAGGATTAAVMAFGAASTGTAISSLSGVAATNATLAFLGGGSLAAGGGGMALGTAVLGGATLGVGLLVGGLIFSLTGSSLSSKADEAWCQMKKAEDEINKVCERLKQINVTAKNFNKVLDRVFGYYQNYLDLMSTAVNRVSDCNGIADWMDFKDDEKIQIENTSCLVGILYNMCKVQLLKKVGENEMIANKEEIDECIDNTNHAVLEIGVQD